MGMKEHFNNMNPTKKKKKNTELLEEVSTFSWEYSNLTSMK